MIWAQGKGGYSPVGNQILNLTANSDHTEARADPGTVFLAVWVWLCVWVCIYSCPCVHMCVHVWDDCICECVHVHVWVCVRACIYKHVCVQLWVHVCMCCFLVKAWPLTLSGALFLNFHSIKDWACWTRCVVFKCPLATKPHPYPHLNTHLVFRRNLLWPYYR